MWVFGLYNNDTVPTRKEVKEAEARKDQLIISTLSKLGIQLHEPEWLDGKTKEDLLKLVNHDKIVNSFRHSTVNKLFRESLAALYLEFNEPLI